MISIEPLLTTHRCRHFNVCGGCVSQNILYEEQQKNKENEVFQLYKDLLSDEAHFYPIIPSIPEWNYRNKMEFTFSNSKAGDYFLGLFGKKSRGKVTDLEECHLCPSWFMAMLDGVRSWWKNHDIKAYHCHSNQGSLRTLTLREGTHTQDRMAVLTVSCHPDFLLKAHELDSLKEVFLQVLSCNPTSFSNDTLIVRTQHIARKMPTYFSEQILYGKGVIFETLKNSSDKTFLFKINSSSFFQLNSKQAQCLYQRALYLGNFSPSDVVLDLYCGTGTLGIFVSSVVKQVIGIELNPEAAQNAQENCLLNDVNNVNIICDDVGKGLARLRLEQKTFQADGIILDPPRSGLSQEALEHVKNFEAKKIVYISCNPKTQIENIHFLLNEGYHLECVQPVDQFPHTSHIENIAVLSK